MTDKRTPVNYQRHDAPPRPESDVDNAAEVKRDRAAGKDADSPEVIASRRVLFTHNCQKDVATKARVAGVVPRDLLAYIAGIKELGLIDANERITVAGAVYKAIGMKGDRPDRQPLTLGRQMARRALWRDIGGTEAALATALGVLIENKLIRVLNGDSDAKPKPDPIFELIA